MGTQIVNWLDEVHVGDCRALMKRMIADGVKVNCIVTSPPYWGLRDYGTAKWVGGDPNCDHMQRVGGTGSSTLGAESGGNDMSDEARARSITRSFVPYRSLCGKCGARRKDNQFGLERTWIRHVARMRGVFRLAHQLLADDGVLWLNYGDSYHSTSGAGGIGHNSALNGSQEAHHEFRKALRNMNSRIRSPDVNGPNRRLRQPGLKNKDKAGIPWRIAFALQSDPLFDWWLRSDCIWHKPNPMPESVCDRPTNSHEYLFLLSKNGGSPLLYRARDTLEWAKDPDLTETYETGEQDDEGTPIRMPRWRGFDYYYDQESTREPASENTHRRLAQNVEAQFGSARANGGTRADRPKWVSGWQAGDGSHSTLDHNQARGPKDQDRAEQGLRDSTKFGRGAGWRKQDAGQQIKGDRMTGFNERWDRKLAEAGDGIKNNASFDEAMVVMPIDRNMRTVWSVLDDASLLTWLTEQPDAKGLLERFYSEARALPDVWRVPTEPFKGAHFATFPREIARRAILAGCPPGGIVFDPFMGSGTVAEVAMSLGRRFIGCELNPESAAMLKQLRSGQVGLQL